MEYLGTLWTTVGQNKHIIRYYKSIYRRKNVMQLQQSIKKYQMFSEELNSFVLLNSL